LPNVRVGVNIGKPHSEHMFSGMRRIAAGSERRQNLRSAPGAVILRFSY
jgi:hypothetical protein